MYFNSRLSYAKKNKRSITCKMACTPLL